MGTSSPRSPSSPALNPVIEAASFLAASSRIGLPDPETTDDETTLPPLISKRTMTLPSIPRLDAALG